MAKLPTIRQFQYLNAVAEHQHFSRAAEACCVSQSTLSSGIHELEEILGVCLFERDKQTVRLTTIGESLHGRAKNILSATEDLMSAARAAQEPFTTEMRLGVIPTIAPFVLPKILKKLRHSYPNFTLFIREDLSAHLVEELHKGKLDVLLLALPYPAENVMQQHLFYDDFLLAYEKHDAIAKKTKIKTRDLKGKDVLLLEDGHCLRDHAMEACKIKTHNINIPYQATSLNTIIQMVANNIGLTILPKMAVDAKILQGTSVEAKAFDEQGIWRSIGLMWRDKSPRQEEFSLLGQLILDSLGDERGS